MPISDSIRYFNKRFTNKITAGLAGKRYSPFSPIEHVGRKSGKRYATPIITLKRGDNFIFALTYGPQVNWYRNILASSTAGLKYQKKICARRSGRIDRRSGKNFLPAVTAIFSY